MIEHSHDMPPENRPQTGRFQPGQSGNPGGRPKLTPKALEVRGACRVASVRAIERLTELLEDPDSTVALKAAAEILRRAWGEPGSEDAARRTDADRLADAKAREQGRSRGDALANLVAEQEPPADVD